MNEKFTADENAKTAAEGITPGRRRFVKTLLAAAGIVGQEIPSGLTRTKAGVGYGYTSTTTTPTPAVTLVYIADTKNNCIRVVNAAGVITTVAGNGVGGFGGDGGSATSSQLHSPFDVAVDGLGNLYIADTQNNRIRMVSGGVITTFAGNGLASSSGDGGLATSAGLNNPTGVAVDGLGNVYIADQRNNRIRMVSAAGIISTVAGNGTVGNSGDGGPATSAQLYFPTGVAVDAFFSIFIGDSNNQRVRRVTAGTITTVAGNGSVGYSIANGNATSIGLHNPEGVAVDSLGNFYFADNARQCVREVTSGYSTTVAGTGIATYSGDGGPATGAAVNNPTGVAVDSLGNLYIADFGNHCVRKSSGGTITTFAGKGTAGFSGDGGLATSAQLYNPSGVAVFTSGGSPI